MTDFPRSFLICYKHVKMLKQIHLSLHCRKADCKVNGCQAEHCFLNWFVDHRFCNQRRWFMERHHQHKKKDFWMSILSVSLEEMDIWALFVFSPFNMFSETQTSYIQWFTSCIMYVLNKTCFLSHSAICVFMIHVCPWCEHISIAPAKSFLVEEKREVSIVKLHLERTRSIQRRRACVCCIYSLIFNLS